MTHDQLRKALAELDGGRSCTVALVGCGELTIHNAMLVPDEPDHLVKLTDGRSIYILDAERIAWIRIGLGEGIQRK